MTGAITTLRRLLRTAWIMQGETGFHVVLSPSRADLEDLAAFDKNHGTDRLRQIAATADALNKTWPSG